MRTIQLVTRTGEHVAWVEVLPVLAEGMAPLVAWGQRAFIKNGCHERGYWRYAEVPIMYSMTPSPGLSEPGAPP